MLSWYHLTFLKFLSGSPVLRLTFETLEGKDGFPQSAERHRLNGFIFGLCSRPPSLNGCKVPTQDQEKDIKEHLPFSLLENKMPSSWHIGEKFKLQLDPPVTSVASSLRIVWMVRMRGCAARLLTLTGSGVRYGWRLSDPVKGLNGGVLRRRKRQKLSWMSMSPSATTLKSLFEPSWKPKMLNISSLSLSIYIYIIYREYCTGSFTTMQIWKLHEFTNLPSGLTTAALADLPVESCLVFHFCCGKLQVLWYDKRIRMNLWNDWNPPVLK